MQENEDDGAFDDSNSYTCCVGALWLPRLSPHSMILPSGQYQHRVPVFNVWRLDYKALEAKLN
jgi:hypothetical protein